MNEEMTARILAAADLALAAALAAAVSSVVCVAVPEPQGRRSGGGHDRAK